MFSRSCARFNVKPGSMRYPRERAPGSSGKALAGCPLAARREKNDSNDMFLYFLFVCFLQETDFQPQESHSTNDSSQAISRLNPFLPAFILTYFLDKPYLDP